MFFGWNEIIELKKWTIKYDKQYKTYGLYENKTRTNYILKLCKVSAFSCHYVDLIAIFQREPNQTKSIL